MKSIDNVKERARHPSFVYMKLLFPNLFLAAHTTNLKRDTYILSKSHRVPYLVSVTWLHLLRHKSEMLNIFKSFVSMIQT